MNTRLFTLNFNEVLNIRDLNTVKQMATATNDVNVLLIVLELLFVLSKNTHVARLPWQNEQCAYIKYIIS